MILRTVAKINPRNDFRLRRKSFLGFILATVLRLFISVFLFCVVCGSGWGQELYFRVEGDANSGYQAAIFRDSQLLLRNAETIRLAGPDLSEQVEIRDWRGSSWSGDETRVQLEGETYVADLDLLLSIRIVYERIDPLLVRKTVELFQPCMPDLYYILEQNAEPAAPPAKYITFECDDFPGGLVHEIFPAAGFVTPDSLLVGVLTDAGYLNHYTRTTRRRFNGHGGGFVGMRRLPDPELLSIDTTDEGRVTWTFGELYNLDAGESEVIFQIEEISPSDTMAEFITPMEDQQVYTISFSAKGTVPVALKLFRIKNGKKALELEHGIKYIDRFPVKEEEWTSFKGSVLAPYMEHDTVALFIGNQSGDRGTLLINNLRILRHHPRKEPYNSLPMGGWARKTTFLFVEPWKSHRDFMIDAQLRLAEGKGFEGTPIEKMLYANLHMLTWITSVHDLTPFNVPNMNYAPDMYNRDAFFSIVSTYDRDLNLQIWDQWGKTQTSEGCIGTIITPYMGSTEAKGNEATIHWLIWALLNKRRFGVDLPEEKIRKAVDYVLHEFDEDGDGICTSHFALNQIDIIDYNPKTDRLAVNQGMLAIALRTIRELGFDLSDEYLEKAETAYRAFYDPQRKHLLFDKAFPDIISLVDLEPEFLSLWLFDRPLLTDSMVINQLKQVPSLQKREAAPHPDLGTVSPICVRLINEEPGYTYLGPEYQPFGAFGESNYKDGARDGYYYNGGSWFRAEYCAYVVGLKHGWEPALKRMENRVWAELYLYPDWPFSKEFIPTKWTSTDSWWPSTRGLCWNVFILMANEVAGLTARSPDLPGRSRPH